MQYTVTYRVSGEERTDHVEAADAAGAVARVQEAHTSGAEGFELLSVVVADDQSASPTPAEGFASSESVR